MFASKSRSGVFEADALDGSTEWSLKHLSTLKTSREPTARHRSLPTVGGNWRTHTGSTCKLHRGESEAGIETLRHNCCERPSPRCGGNVIYEILEYTAMLFFLNWKHLYLLLSWGISGGFLWYFKAICESPHLHTKSAQQIVMFYFWWISPWRVQYQFNKIKWQKKTFFQIAFTFSSSYHSFADGTSPVVMKNWESVSSMELKAWWVKRGCEEAKILLICKYRLVMGECPCQFHSGLTFV